MTEDLYQEVLLEAAENPQNYGTLTDPDFEFQGYNASCGDKITVQLKLDSEEKVTEIAWQGDGCIISQAAMSVVSEAVKGKTLSQIQKLGLADVLGLLHFDTISPGRIKCSMLGLGSICKAIEEVA